MRRFASEPVPAGVSRDSAHARGPRAAALAGGRLLTETGLCRVLLSALMRRHQLHTCLYASAALYTVSFKFVNGH